MFMDLEVGPAGARVAGKLTSILRNAAAAPRALALCPGDHDLYAPVGASAGREPVEREMSVVQAVREIGEKVESGGRITTADARVLWEHASDEELRRLAGLVRARYHEPDRAT